MSGVVVTGGTGTVGRELVRLLAGAGVRVTAVGRAPRADGFPAGVTLAAVDLSQPAGLAPHLAGATALFLNPAAVEDTAEALLDLAAAGGVGHVVLLSAMTVSHPAGDPRFADRFRRLEELVRASGIAWTILQAGDFAGNARVWVPQLRAGDVVRAPYPEAATSPLVEHDLSAVAAHVLTTPGHEGKTYVLTGAASVDQRDKLALIGTATARRLELVELTPEQARTGMAAAGVPNEIIDRLLGSLADYARTPGPTTSTVADLLGRPALSFGDWAVANAALFAG